MAGELYTNIGACFDHCGKDSQCYYYLQKHHGAAKLCICENHYRFDVYIADDCGYIMHTYGELYGGLIKPTSAYLDGEVVDPKACLVEIKKKIDAINIGNPIPCDLSNYYSWPQIDDLCALYAP